MSSYGYRKVFAIFSIILLVVEVVVFLNFYKSSKKSYSSEIERIRGLAIQNFRNMLGTTESTMLQFTTFVQADVNTRRIISEAQREILSVKNENTKKLDTLREELHQMYQDQWKRMNEKFRTKQFHFHLFNSDSKNISFLRFHYPQKYGDDLSDVRHTIMDTKRLNRMLSGYEMGRVYGGIRAVSPIRDNNQTVVGAVELGNSFSTFLKRLKALYGINYSVVLNKSFVNEIVWKDRLDKIYRKEQVYDECYLEAWEDSEELSFLHLYEKFDACNLSYEELHFKGKSIVVSSFPFYDYLRQKEGSKNSIGKVIFWVDISEMHRSLIASITKEAIILIVSYLILCVLLFLSMRMIVNKLQSVIDEKTESVIKQNKQLESFNRTVSHDLKSPLSRVIGLSEYLMSVFESKDVSSLNDEGLNICRRINKASYHMNRMIEHQLQTSNVGLRGLLQQQVYIRDLIKDASNELFYIIKRTNADIQDKTGQARIYGNVELLTELFFNLLSNAIKSTKEGKTPKVIIQEKRTERETIVSVIGFGTEFQDHFLNSEFKAAKKEESPQKVEMNSIRRIAIAHNAHVQIQSVEGKGVAIHVHFPIVETSDLMSV